MLSYCQHRPTMASLPSTKVVFKEDSKCKQCNATFGLMKRRVRGIWCRLVMLYPRFTICSALPRALQHHCRVCGNSFCDVHSPKRVVAYVAARGSSCERSL